LSEHNAKKIHLKISYLYWEIVKIENISLTYDVNDHVNSKLKSINYAIILKSK